MGRAAITFAVNVHDIVNVENSAETVLRLISLFETYGVRGDFYLTAPMVALYERERPDVIERLRQSEMTISYHVRPPHPLIPGFDAPLRGLSASELEQALRDYETYRQDLATGELLRDEPGGYSYVASVFGRSPVVASVPSVLHRDVALPLFASLGARMTVLYHESGTRLERPFEWAGGLLVRPGDFSVTRWALPEHPKESFWWTMLDTPLASDYEPAGYLDRRLSTWTGPRPPLVTALIHEDNFYVEGATPWALVYYEDVEKACPRTPPYDLDAPDPSRPRAPESREAVFAAYERLVAYSVQQLDVVTSEDLVARAEASLEKEAP